MITKKTTTLKPMSRSADPKLSKRDLLIARSPIKLLIIYI